MLLVVQAVSSSLCHIPSCLGLLARRLSRGLAEQSMGIACPTAVKRCCHRLLALQSPFVCLVQRHWVNSAQ